MTNSPLSYMRLWLAACVLLTTRGALAQTFVATNFIDLDPPGYKNTSMTISRNDDMVPLAPVIPLTNAATNQIPPTGLSGEVVQVNADNQYNISSGAVAFISCDTYDYPGNIDQTDVFRSAVDRNVTAVLFYSNQADYCRFDGDKGAYSWVFSMKSRDDTVNVLSAIADANSPLWVTIGGPEVQQGRGESNGSGEESQSDNNKTADGPLGPNPSTAVAMIILYTITGIITALFLVIIVTGAVRAHRHPERYGPRAVIGMGRPRQSRAKGIGRAILDGIPIVKFGEKKETKPTDVELGSTSADASTTRDASATTEAGHTPVSNLDGTTAEDGIAAAGATTSGSDLDSQGCSICTEDFELGQDQRVLPCDHRFHPECIDPWLLNVSGTCPLCRVDLRQQNSRTSQDLDENGNPTVREGAGEDEGLGDLPPPVSERPSVRRSLMIGVLGMRGRPDQMTREERIVALRRYRQEQASRRRQETGTAAAGGMSAEDERTVRRRLRSLLGIRTRRAGQDGPDVQGSGDAADARANDAGAR